ncbi:uncharacterized protein DFL_006900 [Arthrobotrys flagrans]|uniref:ATP-grasp domain-containing protein n=1 Tax=Arthrobotrys flagrans TaxID=97331 RepID=A0A436ZU42_ARTFL|nr:hypothetical protein DFL_006900 [Arthrobotrys flagrans]
MRICVFQSAFSQPNQIAEYSPHQDPGNFTDQHTFDHVWVHKNTAKEQIDEAIAKGYDFYFNFMWGQHEDSVAGIEACKYFESFDLPSIGQRSTVLERTKNDFYEDARRLGYPRVPGPSLTSDTSAPKYPLFVKPASSCGSMFISPKSRCCNREELVECLAYLDKELAPGRAEAALSKNTEATASATIVDGIPIPADLVVQEYVSGWDHSVVVIEVGDCPVALNPERYIYPPGFKPYEDFLTFEIKFHDETKVELLKYEDDPILFKKLQEVAVQAWNANRMAGQSWGNVDIRVPQPGHGDPIALEVNPMPAVFLPPPHDWEDLSVRESFPGGHPAFINALIASHMVRRRARESVSKSVGEVYDNLSPRYDDIVNSVAKSQFSSFFDIAIDRICQFEGTVLDLGSGTGLFGRALAQKTQPITPPESESGSSTDNEAQLQLLESKPKPSHNYTITGIELSKGMAGICQKTGVYSKVHIGPVQSIIPTIGPFDHIVSFSVLYFLTPEEFTLTMVRAFQLARKSLVVGLDEIPDSYTNKLIEMGPPHSSMLGHNHLSIMEKMFCDTPPAGWKLIDKHRQWAWRSPVAGSEVYVTLYSFERFA